MSFACKFIEFYLPTSKTSQPCKDIITCFLAHMEFRGKGSRKENGDHSGHRKKKVGMRKDNRREID